MDAFKFTTPLFFKNGINQYSKQRIAIDRWRHGNAISTMIRGGQHTNVLLYKHAKNKVNAR